MTCHCCNGEASKFGSFQNKNRLVQRFICKRCNKTFSEVQPLQGVRLEDEKVAQVVSLICEGVGINSICRLTEINKQTVLNILVTVGEKCERLLDEKVRDIKPENIEVDELFSYVQRRQDFVDKNDPKRGAFFCYLALDRDSKLIVSHLITKRNGSACVEFLEDVKRRVSGRFQLSTDGYTGYTGQRGSVGRVFGRDIDYGSEVKEFGKEVSMLASPREKAQRKYNVDVCKWVTRKSHIGTPNLRTINTSRVERLNLTFRIFNRRFTRCTLGYSKKIENHRAAAALFTAFYNFCRVHGSLDKKTPAQAAGLTDHKWTALELISSTI